MSSSSTEPKNYDNLPKYTQKINSTILGLAPLNTSS